MKLHFKAIKNLLYLQDILKGILQIEKRVINQLCLGDVSLITIKNHQLIKQINHLMVIKEITHSTKISITELQFQRKLTGATQDTKIAHDKL